LRSRGDVEQREAMRLLEAGRRGADGSVGAYSGAWCSRFPAHRERGFHAYVNTIPS
jgi:hypothetical protein